MTLADDLAASGQPSAGRDQDVVALLLDQASDRDDERVLARVVLAVNQRDSERRDDDTCRRLDGSEPGGVVLRDREHDRGARQFLGKQLRVRSRVAAKRETTAAQL